MVEIVSGSGIDRILSQNEVQEDRTTRLNRLRATEARDGRLEVRAATVARGLEAEALAQAQGQDAAADLEPDAPTRRPRFADLVGDTDSVNRVLEETQGIDRLITAGERLRQAAVLTDSFLKSYFISMIDPGRAMTMISPRDIARPPEEDF
ncbi:MAG: hypothetical protein RLO05_12585 [Rhodospirillales bacterium]|tara:strand:- start:520 stop:972 length:453 start_codon:yes stop_codon:yes gene_type:complete